LRLSDIVSRSEPAGQDANTYYLRPSAQKEPAALTGGGFSPCNQSAIGGSDGLHHARTYDMEFLILI